MKSKTFKMGPGPDDTIPLVTPLTATQYPPIGKFLNQTPPLDGVCAIEKTIGDTLIFPSSV
jgi:hypothetical protein